MIINKKCAECGKEFEYDEKPGFPRKYCFSCGAAKKASYAEKVPVVKPGESVVKESGNNGRNATMYVGYAKDLMVIGKSREEAIADIKALKEAFE